MAVRHSKLSQIEKIARPIKWRWRISSLQENPDKVRSANMRAIRSKNSRPEMAVRRCAHSLGYRYRLHDKRLPGSPDLVFRSRKKVIFVHGCYWHGHGCKRGGSGAKTNTEYWRPKIARNKERDKISVNKLTADGWNVLTLWECELNDVHALKVRLVDFLK
ncbi:very short patch repair endonuclease [Mesorhizobium sp. Root172]|uniref:very short patch repair endonuclease n=1 Tax=Mesorhizobium sp. Root172 TaxID=1736481 RepID=UPI002A4E2139|nr:very short patch repair endonuclease [Mesorhizobium sp. Root172]